MFLQNSYVEVLLSNLMVLAGGAFWEVIRIRWGQEGGAPMMGPVSF